MTAATPNPYLRTKVMTASPRELRLMLLDGAIKFLEQGKSGLEGKDYEAAYNGISRCQSIVMELLNALDPQQAPELCKRLSGLYTYIYTRLVSACSERDTEICDEVLGLLRYERETWQMLIDSLSAENATGAANANELLDQTSETPAPHDTSDRDQNGLIGGKVSLRG
jgi:flagellar protein FliS